MFSFILSCARAVSADLRSLSNPDASGEAGLPQAKEWLRSEAMVREAKVPLCGPRCFNAFFEEVDDEVKVKQAGDLRIVIQQLVIRLCGL